MDDNQIIPSTAPEAQEAPSGINVYDISGDKPVLGSVPHEQVTEAVASGKYSLPKGSVKVVNPDGEFGEIPAEQASEAFKQGYKYASPEDVLQHEHGGVGGQIAAGLEGAGRGLVGPLAPMAEKALGVPEEDIVAREKANPKSALAGEITGLVAPALLSGGISLEARAALEAGQLGLDAARGTSALAKIAQYGTVQGLTDKAAAEVVKAGMKALGTSEASSVAKFAGVAGKAAIENAIIGGNNEIAKMVIHDPETSVQTALANTGYAALLGGTIGVGAHGISSAISPLWKATMGNKVGEMVEDFKGRMKFHTENPDLPTAVQEELHNYYGNTTGAADEVYGASGLKGRALAQAMPEMNERIATQAMNISDTLDRGLQKLSKDPHAGMLEEKILEYKKALGSQSPEEIFNATQNIKQQLQEWGKYNAKLSPLSERSFRESAKDMAFKLRNELENEDVWGKAAKIQQETNKAFSEYLPALKDFQKKFMTDVAGEKIIDAGKVNTYINQTGKASAEVKKQMLGNFLEASEKYRGAIDKLHEKLGTESPITPSSLSAVNSTLQKLTPGSKLADAFVKKGLANLGANALGGTAGGLAGHAMGLDPAITALLGEHTVGPMLESVLPSLTKPILAMKASASGAKAGIDYVMNVVKGETLLNKATSAIFKAGREVLPQTKEPTERDREKITRYLQKIQENPTIAMKGESDSHYYLPQHAVSSGSAIARTSSYLNTQRPSTDTQAPLDNKPTVSKPAQSAYNRTLDIAQQPLMIMKHLKGGTLTTKDVTDLKTMYPSMYTKLCQQVTSDMIDHVNKGEAVPYNIRLGLSTLLGQPVDSTMKPQNIMAAQPKPSQPNPPSQSSTKSMSKMPSQYQTPNQARQNEQTQGK